MNTAGKYFHTIRYLRPVQIAGQVWSRLHKPQVDLRAAPVARQVIGNYHAPIAAAPSLVGTDQFCFLNVQHRCTDASDWDPPGVARLWKYHLHYFDDLNAQDANDRVKWHVNLMNRWVRENPPGHGSGWEPYPLSRRIVNWIKWVLRGNSLSQDGHHSLAVQVRLLRKQLEYHILGNHLFANGKALVYAGLYFDGPEAERWYKKGIGIIERELQSQVLGDGGHFELSTMYHAAFLEDILDLVNFLGAYEQNLPNHWIAVCEKLRHWLTVMCHPDGGIAFFNDAAFGMTPSHSSIESYSSRLGLQGPAASTRRSVFLENSGYVCLVAGSAYLICDCASIGPDYLPAHAHADSLSFELSLGKQRVFVNSGTSRYEDDAERHRQRGTAAHNTVVIDGQDSSEVWSAFRVARRAKTDLHSIDLSLPSIIDASHDGYWRLPGRNLHRRRWILDTGSLQIADNIQGQFNFAEVYFHLHPDVKAQLTGPDKVMLTLQDGTCIHMVFESAASIAVEQGSWHPQFGISAENHYISAKFSTSALITHIFWESI